MIQWFHEIDPDINFYNKIVYHIDSCCNYYMEDAFSSIKKTMYLSELSEKIFSIFHLNIRSLPPNIKDLIFIQNPSLNFILSVLLKPANCDLYCLSRYVFGDRHRHTRKGYGTVMFIKNGAYFQDINDL